MRAFLDESYDRQLKILSYIDNKKKIVSIKEISTNTNFSEKTVLQIIRMFEQENVLSENQFQIIHTNKSIKGIYAKNLDLMKIASSYVKKSVLYKMIRNIFLYEKVDAKRFCEIEYISAPTFSRYRQRLVSILKKFDLELSRDNQIYGEEMKIRNFFFQFFIHSSSEWEFSQQEYQEIETYIYKYVGNWQLNNKVKQQKICLLIYISNIRSSQKHYCENNVLAELSKRTEFEYKEELMFYFYSKKNKTLDQVWHEVSFIQLFMYNENLMKKTLDYEQYEHFFNEQNFPFVKQSNILTERIIQAFFTGLDSGNDKLYLQIRQEIDKMHLILTTCYIDLSLFYYVYNPANFYYRDEAEKKLIEYTEKIVAELLDSSEYQPLWMQLNQNVDEEGFVNYLYLLIYTLLNEMHECTYEPVKIMVQNSKIFIENIISNKFKLIFGDRIQLVSDFRAKPDMLITNVHLSDTPEYTKEIFVNSFSDYADFNGAIDEIKKEIIDKYSQRKIAKPLRHSYL